MKLTVNLVVKEGRLFLPFQNEVENVALETVGSHHGIYRNAIPLTDNLYLKYDRESRCGWEILAKEEK